MTKNGRNPKAIIVMEMVEIRITLMYKSYSSAVYKCCLPDRAQP